MSTNYSATYIETLESTTRFRLDEAARPLVTDAARAQVLAKDLVIALDAGDTTEAKRLALALRPWLGLLEGK
jgi:hypothetical protein